MKKSKCRVLLAIAIMTCGSVSAAFADDPGPGAGTILLVRDSSDFKDVLAGDLRDLLGEAGLAVEESDSMRILRRADFSEYAGIVVVNTGKAGRPNGKVRDFLERGETLPSTVVLTTYGSGKSGYTFAARPGLDGMTSASLKDAGAIRALASDIVTRLGL